MWIQEDVQNTIERFVIPSATSVEMGKNAHLAFSGIIDMEDGSSRSNFFMEIKNFRTGRFDCSAYKSCPESLHRGIPECAG